jgi:hypothetical protein
LATNFFFNNFQNSGEQLLIENLIIESIKIYGHDVYFIRRRTRNVDKIFNEDPLHEYTDAVLVEMYIKNVDGFGGDGDFLSKFNLQIRDQITFSIARRTFADEVGSVATAPPTADLSVEQLATIERDRPLEGDLIYFPLNKKLFEIKFVEHEAIFYQMGALQTYDLRCELFEYNNEYFDTGILEIDRMSDSYSLSSDLFGLMTESGLFITDEEGHPLLLESYDIVENDPTADNEIIEVEADGIIDFTERDPFSEGTY